MEVKVQKPQDKWYFKTYVLVIAFLCVGPFALPLVWINRTYSIKKKIMASLIIIFLTYIIWVMLSASVKQLLDYYKQLQEQLNKG
jgi:hypothetical protein